MASTRPGATTLDFETFWRWLLGHYGCIAAAGGPGCALHDHPDLHWRFAEEADGTCSVLLQRGKDTLAELAFAASDVSHVLVTAEGDETDEDATRFECLGAAEGQTSLIAYFVLTHGYAPAATPPERWTH
jgi:hypothetical protein